MERQKMKQHIEHYRVEVEQAIHEPIVMRDVGRMTIDDAKAFFTLLPLLNGERWTDPMNRAAIAVGAVHAAFAAHDAIDVSDATSTRQQLTVLSGDHFSGIHYRLLASVPAYGFIRSLSGMIGQINEMKTTCHHEPPSGPAKMMEAVRVIEAGCIADFLHTFGFSRYVPFAESVLSLLRLDGVLTEETGSSVYHFWNPVDVDRSMVTFQLELQEALDTADFLAPFLQQEIMKMAKSLLGKPI
jgi:heptaprenyl diphosphate synthase